MRKLSRSILVLSIALSPALSSSLLAAPLPTFGVDQVSTVVVSAWDFDPKDTTMTSSNTFLHRYQTSDGQFLASVALPQGALVLSIELEACDMSATGQVATGLYRGSLGAANTLASVGTGDAETPGCTAVAVDLENPETVENNAHRYILVVQNTTYDGQTLLGAVRVRYRLQVSPAPAIATFNDVPSSDPAFQFIEALAASGVTAGCGGGNYCPDAPLTRRQMAVFLAKLVGLHWPEGSAF